MKFGIFAVFLIACASGSPSALAAKTKFLCVGEEFCWSHRFGQAEGCQKDGRRFNFISGDRRGAADGETLNAKFKRSRSFFIRTDLFQHASEKKGPLNFWFDDTGKRAGFVLKQMSRPDFNNMIWRLSGTCEVIK